MGLAGVGFLSPCSLGTSCIVRPRSALAARTGARWLCKAAAAVHPERLLVTPTWLSLHLEDVTVLDVRGAVRKLDRTYDDETRFFQEVEYIALQDAYISSHVPNSRFVDWTKDIVDEASGQLFNLKSREEFIQAMEEKGVTEDKTVVIYDRGDMLYATRLWFALVYHGHDDVRLLDGGWTRWDREGFATTPDSPCSMTIYSEFSPGPTRTSLLASLDTVQSRDDATTLVDARSASQFDGIERRAKFGGRIPGAINLDRRRLMAEDQLGFLPPEQMRQVFEEHGVDLDRPVLAYCNGGVASTAVLFALHLLGCPLDSLINYDSSWNEYGNLDVAIER